MSELSMNIPILLVIFNRKQLALKTLNAIRLVQPTKLYIACDGPRTSKEGEKERVLSTREAVLNAIDWDCEVKTLFQDTNLGCGKGVFTAVNWLFENEKMGIILEDDCVASPSFFPYVEEMLSKFENDDRIGMIAGHNPIKMDNYDYSIIFSRFKGCWGWATWRRAWKNMDLKMEWRNTIFMDSIIANSGFHAKDRDKWNFELKCIDRNYVSAWDWQWYFCLAAQNQLCVFPKVNLISNIGNDADATHTSFSSIIVPSGELKFPLQLPPYVCPYEIFDRKFYKGDHSIKSFLIRNVPHNLKNKLKKLIRH